MAKKRIHLKIYQGQHIKGTFAFSSALLSLLPSVSHTVVVRRYGPISD